MRKTLLALTLLSTTVLSAAEYSIKAPLESREGGSLPNGSIKFTNQQPTAPTEIWVATTPIYTDWVNDGNPFNCTNWSPDPSTVTIGQTFTQTATDCEQQQTRTRQDREQETTTLAYRNAGSSITESKILTNQSNTRTSTGTKETWVATTPIYTDWVNSGAIYGCSNWTPSPSTVKNGQSFTQTATDCEQDQTRSRQDREQETTTLAYRNAGSSITESKTLTNQSKTRTATGTKSTLKCYFDTTNSPSYGWQVREDVTTETDLIMFAYTASGAGMLIEKPNNSTSITHNGKTYTRGAKKRTTTVSGTKITRSVYEICREEI